MARKVYDMPNDEKQLYNELKKEVQKANSRIKRLLMLEVKTGKPFAVKELHDFLGNKYFNAITKSGYISLKKTYTMQQLIGIKRATEDFLSGVSTYKDIKKLKNEYENKIGKELNIDYVDTLYQFESSWNWILEYIPASEFWSVWVPLAREVDMETWIEQIKYRIGEIPDVDMKARLEALYIYITRE